MCVLAFVDRLINNKLVENNDIIVVGEEGSAFIHTAE